MSERAKNYKLIHGTYLQSIMETYLCSEHQIKLLTIPFLSKIHSIEFSKFQFEILNLQLKICNFQLNRPLHFKKVLSKTSFPLFYSIDILNAASTQGSESLSRNEKKCLCSLEYQEIIIPIFFFWNDNSLKSNIN